MGVCIYAFAVVIVYVCDKLKLITLNILLISLIWCIFFSFLLNKLRECRSVLLLLIECGVAIINTCSPINIYICLHFQDFSFHFLHLLLARLARRVSFAFRISLGNLPKIQTGIYRDLFSLLRRKYFSFTYVSFLFAFIVPLFYTEKGNCFSLTRFTTFYFLSLGFKFSGVSF